MGSRRFCAHAQNHPGGVKGSRHIKTLGAIGFIRRGSVGIIIIIDMAISLGMPF